MLLKQAWPLPIVIPAQAEIHGAINSVYGRGNRVHGQVPVCEAAEWTPASAGVTISDWPADDVQR
jgi:hypothetical protein